MQPFMERPWEDSRAKRLNTRLDLLDGFDRIDAVLLALGGGALATVICGSNVLPEAFSAWMQG